MNEFIRQLKDIWGKLETSQKASIFLIAIVFAGFIAFIGYQATAPSYRALIQDGQRAQVHEIAAFLQDQNIQYRITDNERTVLVQSDSFYRLRNLLSQNDLLGEAGTGFELLDNTGFADSTFKEQKNYDRAVSGELERSFRALRGVKSARVIVVRPETQSLLQDDRVSTASVFLDMESGKQIKR